MEKKIHLHIGQPKTGSTSIQRSLELLRPKLRKIGILFPKPLKLSRGNQFMLVPSILADDPNALNSYPQCRRINFRLGLSNEEALSLSKLEWQSIIDQSKSNRVNEIVISREGFSLLESAGLLRLKNQLKKISGDQVKVYCYLRSPVSLYLSSVFTKISGGNVYILPNVKDLGTDSMKRLDALKEYKNTFGIDVDLRIFEKQKLIDGNVVKDFFHWIGCPILLPSLTELEKNVSLSAEVSVILQDYIRHSNIENKQDFERFKLFLNKVKQHDRELPEPTKMTPKSDLYEYITRFDKTLIPLREEYGISFADIDYSIAGNNSAQNNYNFEHLKNIEDICYVNMDRKQLLLSKVNEAK